MQPFLEITLTNVVMATGLALIAAVVAKVFHRPVLSHFLWLLVLLKLVTPPLIPVRLSLPAALEAAFVEPDSIAVSARTREAETTVPDGADLWEAGDESGADWLDPDFVLPELVETNPYRAKPPTAKTEIPQPAAARGWNAADNLTWACVAWFGGSVLWLIVAAARVYSFQRLLRHARPAPESLQFQAAILAQRMGLARCPALTVVPGRVSPLLWALGGRVRLVLPAGLLSRLRPEQQVTLVAHELAHARRRDHWVRWLEFVVTGLYWWLPVAWWARRQLQEAEEECCDAWVVWMLPAAAKAYAKALLQTVDFLDARPALPPAASGLGHLYLLKRRLTMIVHERLCPRLPWPVHVGTVLLGMMILPIAPQRLAAESPSADDIKAQPPAAAAFNEDDPPPRSGQESQLRELERRMNRLEERLDRVLRSLEGRGERRTRTEELEKAKEMSREDREKASSDRRRVMEVQKETLKNEARKRAEETAKSQRGKEFRSLNDWKRMDPERIKDLEKQIQDTVNKTFSPERMKELEKQIQSIVEKNVNPERMKDLDKQIQALVERTVNPERMQALQRQIEGIIARNMPVEQRERSSREDRPRTPEVPAQPRRAEQPRAPAGVTRPPDPTAPRGLTTSRTGSQRDLERRLDKLEEKMDRLLQALETKEKPGKGQR